MLYLEPKHQVYKDDSFLIKLGKRDVNRLITNQD